MIRIQRRTLITIGILVGVSLLLAALVLAVEYYLQQSKNYIRGTEVLLRRDEMIGQQIRVRDYLVNKGVGETIQACNPPQNAFTSFGLSGIHLMDCTVAQCTMTCPLFMPHIGEGYEIVGKLEYCPDSDKDLCLVNVSEVYLLVNAGEELDRPERKIPVSIGSASFPIGQEWEQWKP